MRTLIAEVLQRQGAKVAAKLGPRSPLVRSTRPLYNSALAWMAAARPVVWSINGVNYRIDIRYRDQMAHHYEPAVAAFLKGIVKPGCVCFDVGANVGAYVLQLCHWSAPSGRVVAFEPNPQARKALERHLVMNGFEESVQIVSAAVGSTESEVAFYAAGFDGMSRIDSPNPALAGQSRELTVPLVTLDGFIRDGGLIPDLILIDVEGFELGVLEGARETIRSRRGALHIVVEMHPTLWPAGMDYNRMTAFLAEQNLTPRCLTGQGDPLRDYGLVYLECT